MPWVDGPRTDASPPTAPPALIEGRPPRRPLVFGLVRSLVTFAGLLGVYCLLPLHRPFTAGTLLLLGAVFATVGFGDISPVSDVARVLVTVQMVGDLVVIGLVLRLFLTAVDRGRRRASGREDSRPAGDDTPPEGRS